MQHVMQEEVFERCSPLSETGQKPGLENQGGSDIFGLKSRH